jgi:type II secretory pathway component PulC
MKMNWTTSYLLAPLLAVIALVLVVPAVQSSPLPASSTTVIDTEREVRAAMQHWIAAVVDKQARNHGKLVDSNSEAYYLRLRDLALTAGAEDLSQLSEVDQLQIMFFRLMVDAEQLSAMSAQQLLAFAVEKGFIGMELRLADQLSEIQISGDTATGRLLKFGRVDRPDRYRQYFVKELDTWRVSVQGERDRLEGEFDGFVQRSGLSRSEAAFVILEMRLMRKVTAADFFALSDQVTKKGERQPGESDSIDVADRFRLVSVRLSEALVGIPAVTVDDTDTGLKHVLQRGDSIPGYPEFKLLRISPNKAVFHNNAEPAIDFTLGLDARDRLTRRAAVAVTVQDSAATLFDEASLGEKYPGQMMMQWRNTGLRGRPQLLQQAWLTPDFGGAVGPDKSMLGLRVRQVTEASFWDQIGLEDGDLLREINGLTIGSLDAWKKAIRIAETDQEIRVILQRGDHELTFRTLTMRPG